MKHKFSIETLYHFNCGHCKSWWSIGDFNIARYKTLTCPYCGETELLVDNTEDTYEDYPQEIIALFDKFETLL